MKKMKKLLSMLLTVIMVLAMAAPSFATEGDVSITVNGNGKSFAAYRLLNAEQQEEDSYIYSVNDTYKNILISVLNLESDATEGQIIGAISSKESTDLRTFADAVYAEVKDMDPDATANAEDGSAVFEVSQGYYLIVETAAADSDDAISLVMLDTAGEDGVSVNTKSDTTPKPGKKVVNDEKSFAVGDFVQYELTATLPADYDVYTEYELTFVDEMSEGLTYVGESDTDYANHQTKVNGTTLEGEITYLNNVLTIKFDDTKLDSNLGQNDTITITYWAKVNENAVTGANENTLKLEFSNNPYNPEGKGTTTTTPNVNIYNFEVNVNKVDISEAPLSGATFTLIRLNEDMTLDSSANATKVITSENAEEGYKFNFTGLKAGKYKLEETTPPQGYNAVDPMYFEIIADYDEESGNISTLSVKILNENGEAVTEEEPSISVSGNIADCKIATTVVNSTGAQLPATGGIGTTIFYAAGIILMAGAVFFVVRRKRA